MNYSQIRNLDVSNGLGIRISIFTSGCTLNCPNCFNPEYQNFDNGEVWDDNVSSSIIDTFNNSDYIVGLSLLGGEPTLHSEELVNILEDFEENFNRDYDIWIYSGYIYEDLMEDTSTRELLNKCDVLVDGPFIEKYKDLNLKFRGSSNQRIIDLKNSTPGNVTLYEI